MENDEEDENEEEEKEEEEEENVIMEEAEEEEENVMEDDANVPIYLQTDDITNIREPTQTLDNGEFLNKWVPLAVWCVCW